WSLADTGVGGWFCTHRPIVVFLLTFSQLRSTDGRKGERDSSGKGDSTHARQAAARSRIAARAGRSRGFAAPGSGRRLRHRARHGDGDRDSSPGSPGDAVGTPGGYVSGGIGSG